MFCKIITSLLTIFFLSVINAAYASSDAVPLTSFADKNDSFLAILPVDSLENEETKKEERTGEADSDKKTEKKRIEKLKNLLQSQRLKGEIEKVPEATTRFEVWLDNDYLTGDWAGLRSTLEKQGITLEGTYTVDSSQKTHGGLQRQGAFRTFGLLDVAAVMDTEKMGLWKGSKFVTRFQNKSGKGGIGEHHVGALQLINNFDEKELTQISEYYYEQLLFADKFRIKIGKQDADKDFMELELGSNFFNESVACYAPNIPLPAYPDPALGILLEIRPIECLACKFGAYDGHSHGGSTGFDTVFTGSNFFISEMELEHNLMHLPGKVQTGCWLCTGDVEELSVSDDCKVFKKTMGAYAQFEQMIWRKSKEDLDDDRGLSLLAQFSTTPSDRSEIDKYYGAGFIYKGLLPGRDDDIAGISAAIAHLCSRLKNIDGRKSAEAIFEVFYKIRVTPWLSIQPGVQFISNPNGKSQDACVIALRTVLTF